MNRTCACRTSWIVDFEDRRGVVPVTAEVAVRALQLRFRVWLASISQTSMVPISPCGVQYSNCNEVVREKCEVCGYPTVVDKITAPSSSTAR